MHKVSSLKIIKAAFLISGTCIGGGMLALPISSSSLGFFPTVLVMFVCCLFMTLTGLLYLEATLWMKSDAHINTLSARLLNGFWRVVCWLVYLFICYASLVAYISGGGKEIAFVMTEILHSDYTIFAGMLTFCILFGIILFLGHRSVERVNSILFVSMIAAYLMLISLSSSKISFELIAREHWNSQLLFVSPIILTMFSFPGIVPTITPYLERNPQAVKKAIILGTSMTFMVYFLWLLLVFGTVPLAGEHGLQEAFFCDIPATECLHYALKNPAISAIAQFFAFFALATSFLGISLSLFDFLKDTIHLKIGSKTRGLFFCALILAPSLLCAMQFERAFITALELSGGIGDALISGIIPVLMVWKGRSRLAEAGGYQLPGGKPLLIGIALFASLILCCEVGRRVFF
jgi:tyrosine-specific transport protein